MKMLFVHLPRTGGTFLGEFFRHIPEIKNVVHTPVRKIKNRKDYFSFGFIRNPFDWYVSRYFYFCKNKPSEQGVSIGCDLGMSGNHFKEHCKSFKEHLEYGKKIKGFWLSDRYNQMFCNAKGKLLLNYVGKFENLKKEIDLLIKKTSNENKEFYKLIWEAYNRIYNKQQKKTNSTEHNHYSKYYTPELIKLISEKDKLIIDRYGY